jgi:hypothetical protein
MVERSRWLEQPLARFAVIVFVLGTVAAIAQTPQSGDRDIYQQIGRHGIVLNCADIHCFRVLPAPILEHLPGPSIIKWKTYAVITNAAAAVALGGLCVALGLSARAAGFATWIAAFGLGPLQSVFDPYTSDPVMYLAGPILTTELLRNQIGRATIVASAGVFFKEFVAAPLWIFAFASALRRRWDVAIRVALAAYTATLAWLALQTVLLTVFNYSYGGNKSVDLLHGGYLAVWVGALGWPRAIVYLLVAFGPLLLLMAAGFRRATRTLRLLFAASIAPALVLMYVQQPDRALWNFHFVVIPIAVLVLQELPDSLCWLFVVSFATANVRLGELQPAALSWARGAMFAVSIGVALKAMATPPRDLAIVDRDEPVWE